jgi:hypothetical protein
MTWLIMQPETSPNTTLPPFTGAIARFAAFLEHEGVPPQLLWVDREDVTSHPTGAVDT